MSILTAVQKFCQRTGLPQPTSVVGSSDAQIIQILGLAEEVCEDLIDRKDWTDLSYEVTFVTQSGLDQGSLVTICPNGFRRIVNDTIFNRSTALPLYGPLSPQVRQAIKASAGVGPLYQYYIQHKRLFFSPATTAGQTCAFEYISDQYAVAVDGTTFKSGFTVDTDSAVFDEKLLIAGLRWKWKAEKGFDYTEEFRRYENLVSNYGARDGSAATLSMNAEDNARPGIFIPAGFRVPQP